MIEAPLQPGGDPLEMARRVARFLGEARSLDLALYDVRLPGEPGDLVAGALRDAAARGVRVRIAYNADHPERESRRRRGRSRSCSRSCRSPPAASPASPT